MALCLNMMMEVMTTAGLISRAGGVAGVAVSEAVEGEVTMDPRPMCSKMEDTMKKHLLNVAVVCVSLISSLHMHIIDIRVITFKSIPLNNVFELLSV